MKWLRGVALVVALASCTSPNPNYVGPTLGDGGGGFDMSVTDGPPGGGDLSAVCMAGMRGCLSSTVSASCEAGQFKLDRKCPNQSMCAMGYCSEPPQSVGSIVGTPCDQGGGPQENACFSTGGTTDALSCEPFVNPSSKAIDWICNKAVGAGLPGTMCTTGDDCRSGFCGSNHTCFRSCLDQTDCPFNNATGMQFQCGNVDIVVEGIKLSVKSCIP
jgi:hypothetical protein